MIIVLSSRVNRSGIDASLEFSFGYDTPGIQNGHSLDGLYVDTHATQDSFRKQWRKSLRTGLPPVSRSARP
jgi:hypothetical protein